MAERVIPLKFMFAENEDIGGGMYRSEVFYHNKELNITSRFTVNTHGPVRHSSDINLTINQLPVSPPHPGTR